jgi:predicted Zn-dependent peptidase
VRVAAEDNNDSTTCVGLGIDVGARFETKEEQGMSALLKRMLLGGRFSQRLEQLGASLIRSDVSCKDSIYVAAEVLRPHAEVRRRDFLVCFLFVHRLVGPLAFLLAGGPL